jgi:hypothetical protein
MENGVSGDGVGRARRSDNEDNAMGERATGRSSSSAKGGEPMRRKHRIGTAKDPHRRDKSVSQPEDPPAVRCAQIAARSLLST